MIIREKVARGEAKKKIRGYIKKDLKSFLKYFESITGSP